MKKYFARILSALAAVVIMLSLCVNERVNVAAASESQLNFTDVVRTSGIMAILNTYFQKR